MLYGSYYAIASKKCVKLLGFNLIITNLNLCELRKENGYYNILHPDC